MIERKNKTGKKGPPDSIRQAVPFNTVRRIRLKAGHFIHQPISTITFDLLSAGCTGILSASFPLRMILLTPQHT